MKDGPSDSNEAEPWLNHKTLNLSDEDMPTNLKELYKRLLPLQRDKNIMPRSCKVSDQIRRMMYAF